jgi:hypothetical protein
MKKLTLLTAILATFAFGACATKHECPKSKCASTEQKCDKAAKKCDKAEKKCCKEKGTEKCCSKKK